ncbi:thioredoxin family protein [Balneolales bacterium ANBcel1]|nr:thioredoxin family protein [Balneolales bacterium ANBcel1]
MKHPIISILIVSLTVFALLGAGSLSDGGPTVGERAPDFTLTDAAGETHSLSDYEGQFVVLEWLNHECPFVVKHYGSGNMQMLQEHYRDQGVVWFSIISSAPGKQGYMEPDEAVQVTSEKNARPTAVLLDPEGVTGRAYDARVTPHMYIINPDGVLEYMGAIDDNPSANPADIEGARNFVSEALDLLLDGGSPEVTSHPPYGCTVKY